VNLKPEEKPEEKKAAGSLSKKKRIQAGRKKDQRRAFLTSGQRSLKIF
jgi:hypothetical protein